MNLSDQEMYNRKMKFVMVLNRGHKESVRERQRQREKTGLIL